MENKRTISPLTRLSLGVVYLMLSILISVTIHYANEVRIARRDTKMLVEKAMKRYGIKLIPSALSHEQKKCS